MIRAAPLPGGPAQPPPKTEANTKNHAVLTQPTAHHSPALFRLDMHVGRQVPVCVTVTVLQIFIDFYGRFAGFRVKVLVD
jgi:hypothetical protein